MTTQPTQDMIAEILSPLVYACYNIPEKKKVSAVLDDTLAKLVAAITRTKAETIEEAERFVREEMDKTELETNQEFIACDDLAIKIIKRLRAALEKLTNKHV